MASSAQTSVNCITANLTSLQLQDAEAENALQGVPRDESIHISQQVHARLINDLTAIFDARLQTFKDELNKRVEALVNEKVNERLKFLSASETNDDGTINNVLKLEDNISELTTKINDLQVQLDGITANNLVKRDENSKLREELVATKENVETLSVKVDGIEQQGRKETVEFHNLPYRCDFYGHEDTDKIVVDFCNQFLGMKISRSDISISHRQEHPDEKAKLGDRYLPSIYAKFTRRKTAHTCMEKRHLIRNLKNYKGQEIFLRENLTLDRRMLWDRVDKELHSFAYKWVKNGKIFVRRFPKSRSIKILSEKVLDELLKKQPNKELIVCHNRIISTRPRKPNNITLGDFIPPTFSGVVRQNRAR